MYCIALGSKLLVQDFKSYPDEFPFRDLSCLLQCTPTILKDLVNMHIDDAHDDKMVAEETALQVHTRAQSRAAQTVSIIEAASSSPCPDPTADPIDQFTESVMPPRSAHTSTRTTDEIAIHDNLDDLSELAIARALLKHSLEFVLPAHYKPDVTGEMRVVGVDALKLTKSKAVLIVKFLSPQSLRDTTMQMFCTSLKPKRGLGQGEDLRVLTAIKHTLPYAISLHAIGVCQLSASGVTRAMIADFNSLHVGLIFDASHVTPGDNETSEQSPTTSDFNIRSAQDPIGYTKATPDLKHHGQAMRSSMRTKWIKSQNLEMQGIWIGGNAGTFF